MNCSIQVVLPGFRPEYVFLTDEGCIDKAGAIVAIAARNLAEGIINDSEAMIDWFLDCQNWAFLPRDYDTVDSDHFYDILVNRDRQGKVTVEIGYSVLGQSVKYYSLKVFIKMVNEQRKWWNEFSTRNFFGLTNYRMLRQARV